MCFSHGSAMSEVRARAFKSMGARESRAVWTGSVGCRCCQPQGPVRPARGWVGADSVPDSWAAGPAHTMVISGGLGRVAGWSSWAAGPAHALVLSPLACPSLPPATSPGLCPLTTSQKTGLRPPAALRDGSCARGGRRALLLDLPRVPLAHRAAACWARVPGDLLTPQAASAVER